MIYFAIASLATVALLCRHFAWMKAQDRDRLTGRVWLV